MSESEKPVAVKFTRGMAPYNAGETAGFPKEHAERLVARGYATKVVLPDVAKEPASSKPAAPVQK